MDDAAPTLPDLLRLRQQDTFVGRDSRIAEFRTNLGLPPADPRRRYIVNVHGIAGVGKSFLLQQFRRIADAEGAASALVNEDYFDIVDTMAALAADFAARGARLTGFEAGLATYRQRRSELESDPNAPLGDLVTTTTVRTGLALARTVPMAGAVAEFVDADAVALQANRFRAYLVRRFGKKADIDLLLSPIDVLTRAFVAAVNEVAATRPALLMFDTFERTAPYLESWVLDLFTGRFGGLSANAVTVIAGQLPLSDNRWSPLRSLIAAHPLEPFTEAEARDFLHREGVADEAVVEVILPLSGRIPMWLATLAEHVPEDPGDVLDPSDDAVKRFLKWEPDDQRRKLAKAAALPRRFNHDVLRAIPGADGADDLFGWLLQLPFVSRTGDHWRYHDAVRDPMLRLARITSPQQWRDQHRALADHFAAEQEATGLTGDDRWPDPVWQSLAMEEHYHRLCAAPRHALRAAFAAAVDASDEGISPARRWTAMLTAAGGDAGSERLRSWGTRLTGLLKDRDDDTAFLTALIDSGELDHDALANALAGRGCSHRNQHRYGQALADLDRAVGLRSDQAHFYYWRGLTHRFLNRSDDAVADFTRALELRPGSSVYYAQRGVEFRLARRYDEALADFDRSIAIAPGSVRRLEDRGITYQLTERFEEALADFGAALAIDPDDDDNLAQRGYTYHLLDRHEEALRDLNRALELNPDASWTYGLRGIVHASQDREAEALADFDRAVELDPDLGMPFTRRGGLYRTLGRHQEALADLDRAIELDAADYQAYVQRGVLHADQGRQDLALADLDRAIAIDPRSDWSLVHRAQTLRAVERYREALADLDRAVALRPDDPWVLTQRGRTYVEAGRFGESFADLDRAIALDPGYGSAYVQRARAHRSLGRYEQARDDFDRAAALVPEYEEAIAQRGEMHRLLGDLDAALADFDRAVALAPDDTWNPAERSLVHLLRGDPDAATADLAAARTTDPSSSWWRYSQGLILKSTGSDEEAAAEFLAAVDLVRAEAAAEPDAWPHRFNAVLYLLLAGRIEAAREHLREVLAAAPPPFASFEFLRDLAVLTACPGLDVEGVDEFERAVAEHLGRPPA
ncbi:tetratricopeptide repeat protein [Glycomyces endophyticus]|uniref:Tetratricopeptide repeat protein n=1 Tax=Glycomyces endophyticus TaxID=480996 RepID=A0ABN2G5N4_9ACTN